MESSIVDASAVSRKRRRDEEEEEELEQVFFIIVSVVTMLLGALTWYHDKYFVKEPVQNLELERHSFLNRFKVIPNWDDIVDLCVKDRATGLGAENALDADDIMSKETNEEEAIHSVSFDLEGSSSAMRKNIRPSKSEEKEGMISSMKEVAESLKEFVEVTKKMENKKRWR
ncbi:hypothetical protein AAZX31_18G217000 [Glycine max]